jgi:hypothetical protein
MDPIAVDVRMVRALLGSELRLTPGRVLMARVVATGASGRGALNIAGSVIDAELPGSVRAGQELRLIVRHVTPEKVVLSLSDQTPTTATPAAIPLPGGGGLRVTDQDAEDSANEAASDAHVLSLRYDAPTLGAVDLRFELRPSSLRLAVSLQAGDSVQRAQAGADELQRTLREILGRSVSVAVTARREPIDIYA